MILISFVKGKVADISENSLVVENGGSGSRVAGSIAKQVLAKAVENGN